MNFAEQIEFLCKVEKINIEDINAGSNIIVKEFDKLIINTNLIYTSNIKLLPEGVLDNCIINGNLWLDDLTDVPKKFLQNSIVNGLLCLNNLEYLPKGFYCNVNDNIGLKNLKSITLKDLIRHPGPSRQLAFNLLKTI